MIKCKCGNTKEFILTEEVPHKYEIIYDNEEKHYHARDLRYVSEMSFNERIYCEECGELFDISDEQYGEIEW